MIWGSSIDFGRREIFFGTDVRSNFALVSKLVLSTVKKQGNFKTIVYNNTRKGAIDLKCKLKKVLDDNKMNGDVLMVHCHPERNEKNPYTNFCQQKSKYCHQP